MLGNIGSRGATLVVGPSGSGKTTLLRQRYVDLVRSGEKGVLLLVHNRRAARMLGDQILRDLGASTDQVRVATWHAYGLSLLRAHHRALGYVHEPALLSGPEQFALVRDMLDDEREREHWRAFPKQLALDGFVEELREFVLRAQDALLSPEQVEERARAAGRDDLAAAALFFRRYLGVLDAREDAVIDHANVIARAWQVVSSDEAVATAVRAETTHLLVDDYQNVTPAQAALLRELVVPGGSVVVAADPEAGIFGFRGSTEGSLEEFRRRFAPVTEIALTDNHRGEPHREAWLFDHLTEEADAIARECLRLNARDGTGFGDIAVVVRRYGAIARAVRAALERTGVPHVVVGENRPLQDEPALRPMLDLARASVRTHDHAERLEELLPALLGSAVGGFDPNEVRGLRRAARLRGVALSALLADPGDLAEHVAARLRALAALVEEAGDAEERADRPDEVFWFLWQRLDYFRAVVAEGDEDALDAVAAFARAIERFSDRRPDKRFRDYLEVLEGVEFGPEPWNMPEERRPDAVRVLTAHAAAGAEFDTVIVAGCVEGEFPDPHEPRRILDLRDLVAPATPHERRMARLGEERRLFGVATTRARRRLVLTAAEESSQREPLAPSPLAPSAGVEWARRPPFAPGEDALTRDEAEAAARRALRAGTSAEREAALALLAMLPGVDPDTWWYEREWTDPGTPLVAEELRTSYSRLNEYDNCALKYLYQVELGLDPETSHQMLVGTWVHDIVDGCARGEIAATEDALIAALDEVWDPLVFDSVAIEHRRRLDCEEMLRRWLRNDGGLDTRASEVAFEFPIDGATIRGRIDRVVRLGRSMVRLIDYKTGRSAKNNDQAKEDLQLATYYLALKRDPQLSELGEPKYLELAYLGVFTRGDGFMRAGVDPTREPEYEKRAQERLEGFVEGIRAERFAPSPSANCQWCRFKTLCPVWPEGDEVAL